MNLIFDLVVSRLSNILHVYWSKKRTKKKLTKTKKKVVDRVKKKVTAKDFNKYLYRLIK